MRRVLYVYVEDRCEPSDASCIAAQLERAVSVSKWGLAAPEIVNEISSLGDQSGHRELPPWDVGLSLALPDAGCAPCGWFRDVERFARITGDIVSHTGHRFVVGVAECDAGLWEDLFVIDTPTPDVVALAAVVTRLTGLPPPT